VTNLFTGVDYRQTIEDHLSGLARSNPRLHGRLPLAFGHVQKAVGPSRQKPLNRTTHAGTRSRSHAQEGKAMRRVDDGAATDHAGCDPPEQTGLETMGMDHIEMVVPKQPDDREQGGRVQPRPHGPIHANPVHLDAPLLKVFDIITLTLLVTR
jgi:hypothetical protein